MIMHIQGVKLHHLSLVSSLQLELLIEFVVSLSLILQKLFGVSCCLIAENLINNIPFLNNQLQDMGCYPLFVELLSLLSIQFLRNHCFQQDKWE